MSKLSRYNFEVEHDECLFLYNGLSNKLLQITYDEYSVLETLLEHLPEFEKMYPFLYNDFKDAGFIIDDDFDEIGYIKLQNNKAIYANRDYRITINPTLECNLKCWYCSVEYAGARHYNGYMSKETITALKNHVQALMINKRVDSILLDWFGGEPMMLYDEVMRPVSQMGVNHAEELGVNFMQQITTNGTLLNEARISEMKDFKFNFFQISTDGNERHHNKIKHFEDKTGSYRKVFENINLITSIIPEATIILRINYDKQTIKDAAEVINDLSETSKKRIIVGFERVWQVQMTEKEERLLYKTKREFEARGLIVGSWEYNPRWFKRCYADNFNHYVINYNGKIFKCTARDYSDDMLLGNLMPSGEIDWNEKLVSKYFSKATFENNMCERCKVLPLCMGPCIQKAYEARKHNDTPKCVLRDVEVGVSSYVIAMAKTMNLI